MTSEGETKIRLTKQVRQQLLDQNEGLRNQTYYEGKNYREQRDYEIRGGELHIRSRGKTSWADSRFDEEFVADDEQTRRFLRNNLHDLNTDGLTARPSAGPGPDAAAAPGEKADASDDGSAQDSADEPIYVDVTIADDDDYDETEDNSALWVAGAVVAYFVARAAAPHAKRWWTESLAPRARRVRRRLTAAEPAGGSTHDPALSDGPKSLT